MVNTMKSVNAAFIFPGQGAQKVGMGRDLFDASSAAKSAFEEANTALGEDLTRLIFEGPAEDLTLTANTQPSIVTVSIAALRALYERAGTVILPKFAAGHSLGEFSALTAASAMTLTDAIRITRKRGTFMQEAVPAGKGGMAAVMGDITLEKLLEVCKAASQDQTVAPANLNAPNQVVISGHKEAVERASNALEAMDMRVIPLQVSAPFHSTLMQPAAEKLAAALNAVEIEDMNIPVVTNVEATPNSDKTRVKSMLIKQVTSPVRWTESMQAVLNAGVTTFIEFGPGNVLAGLMKRIDKNAAVISVNSIEGLDKALSALEKV
jgi:[acyl-carrier-protein] S-malonyltransferase